MNKKIAVALAIVLCSPVFAAAAEIQKPLGNGQPYCSGPMAPGWVTGTPNGGCPTIFLAPGASTVVNSVAYTCPWFYTFAGCFVK